MVDRRCLYVVVCGARAAADVVRAVDAAHSIGWDAAVIPTPMGARFLGDITAIEKATGFRVRTDYKRPDEEDVLPVADAFLVSPLTFNSLNKWAAGISDTLAMRLLNEALGLNVPIAAVPWLNHGLAAHPAVAPNIALLQGAGVSFTSGLGHRSSRVPGPDGQLGAPQYPWTEVEAWVGTLPR